MAREMVEAWTSETPKVTVFLTTIWFLPDVAPFFRNENNKPAHEMCHVNSLTLDFNTLQASFFEPFKKEVGPLRWLPWVVHRVLTLMADKHGFQFGRKVVVYRGSQAPGQTDCYEQTVAHVFECTRGRLDQPLTRQQQHLKWRRCAALGALKNPKVCTHAESKELARQSWLE